MNKLDGHILIIIIECLYSKQHGSDSSRGSDQHDACIGLQCLFQQGFYSSMPLLMPTTVLGVIFMAPAQVKSQACKTKLLVRVRLQYYTKYRETRVGKRDRNRCLAVEQIHGYLSRKERKDSGDKASENILKIQNGHREKEAMKQEELWRRKKILDN